MWPELLILKKRATAGVGESGGWEVGAYPLKLGTPLLSTMGRCNSRNFWEIGGVCRIYDGDTKAKFLTIIWGKCAPI